MPRQNRQDRQTRQPRQSRQTTASTSRRAVQTQQAPVDTSAQTTQPATGISEDVINVSTEGIIWGLVDTYSVNSERMMIKLNVSAIRRQLISVGINEPHFRTAVSITMMAYNNNERISVRYRKSNLNLPQNAGGLNILQAQEVAISQDPGNAFAFADWSID